MIKNLETIHNFDDTNSPKDITVWCKINWTFIQEIIFDLFD